MAVETFQATHKLKKDFVIPYGSRKEIYKKGTPVKVPRRHHKHDGMCCNVVFLTRTGRIKSNWDQAMAIFSTDFFKPYKEWFEPI